MNVIIVPTDFSKAAENALMVAKGIALKTNATIHLANFYSLPIADYSYPDISMPAEILEQIRKSAKEGIERLKINLETEGFKVESTIEMGMVSDEIVDLANKINSDLIIMGTTGASGIVNKLFGSNAANVMQRTNKPILLVPQDCNCNGINDVIYLDELIEDDTAILTDFFAFADELGIMNIKLLNVNTGFFYQPIDEQLMNRLDKTFGLDKIKLETVDGADVKDGITHYLENHKVDMVVMSTHKKTFLERIFAKSETRKIALYSKIPLLVYHK